MISGAFIKIVLHRTPPYLTFSTTLVHILHLVINISSPVAACLFGYLADEISLLCQLIWISFLMSYQDQARSLGLSPLDLGLVEYLSLRQYLFEIIYAQKYLPRWIYAPVISLQQELG